MADNSRPTRHRVAPAAHAPVQVLIGGRWLTAKAHAVRGGRRGAQVLITCYGRLVWITATRVRRPQHPSPQHHDLPDRPAAHPPTRAGLAAGTDGPEDQPKR
ncbi:hypothetical protein [Kribbella caucasensis]|uniref:hypothetical protein n=1 Tax=Kribbella caucasensis TaxID=2512215 RepID=UPI00105E792B|nr:hypothetical protein [Kribbella sp. VKM Ac-2527]